MGVVSSRSSVPVVRSRSIATEVTRNIVVKGNSASSGPPTCVEDQRLVVVHVAQQGQEHDRYDEQQRHRPVVARS